jgi:phosphoribosylpyrophosphate synthetase
VVGSGNKAFTDEVAAHLGITPAKVQTGKFKDGETFVKVSLLYVRWRRTWTART